MINDHTNPVRGQTPVAYINYFERDVIFSLNCRHRRPCPAFARIVFSRSGLIGCLPSCTFLMRLNIALRQADCRGLLYEALVGAVICPPGTGRMGFLGQAVRQQPRGHAHGTRAPNGRT